ncbi:MULTISPECIES: cytidine deaminase [Paenibacillus]|uniref:cytidine deaminase n=1 Tax=Paenibacillus TaxID=44249 RepID=UPI000FD91C9C|nr:MULTISPECIES: cytidine deaminase [Paenibacillus]MCP1425899.1 cytidine deaminase [Paenibacillus xylanexedens]
MTSHTEPLNIEQQLFDAAAKFVKQRYPQGWGGAGAVYTEAGSLLISVAPEVINDATHLCMETGAYLEAHKLNERVTHSLCIARDDEHSEFKVLTPCGVCQERLFYWGEEVKAAVYDPSGQLVFKRLDEIQPYHWSKAYRDKK